MWRERFFLNLMRGTDDRSNQMGMRDITRKLRSFRPEYVPRKAFKQRAGRLFRRALFIWRTARSQEDSISEGETVRFFA